MATPQLPAWAWTTRGEQQLGLCREKLKSPSAVPPLEKNHSSGKERRSLAGEDISAFRLVRARRQALACCRQARGRDRQTNSRRRHRRRRRFLVGGVESRDGRDEKRLTVVGVFGRWLSRAPTDSSP